MKKLILFAIILLFASNSVCAKSYKSSVAIVIDEKTYSAVKSQVNDYQKSIEIIDGKSTFLFVVREDMTPSDIRAYLLDAFNTKSLEGAVIIGDVPIPMIRDAHHLASAFKMNPKANWKKSSIPSDRYYDDFGLKFDFIKQDEDVKSFYYYSLRADSEHFVECDIYSARIKPMLTEEDPFGYKQIGDFLTKAAKSKNSKKEIKSILHFAGHGYNSESINARIDENRTLYQQFPNMPNGGRVEFFNFDHDAYVKYRLMEALSSDLYDIALLHHHGGTDAQYLCKTPYSYMITSYIENAKKFFRGKIRGASDTTAYKKYYLNNYQVPESWVSNAFDKDIMYKDSLIDAAVDIASVDLEGYKSNVKFLMLDACFNGNLRENDYIAARYIFNEGSTMVVRANSVNVLQDTWTNEMIGLLSEGVCVGNWAKEIAYLESHLYGDPTYKFENSGENNDYDYYLGAKRGSAKYWKKCMESKLPDVRSMGLRKLYEMGQISDQDVLSILKSDSQDVVRTEAFNLLRKNSKLLTEAFLLGMNDRYEIIRRFATKFASLSGDPLLMNELVRIYFNPDISSRELSYINAAFDQYPVDILFKEMNRQRELTSRIYPTDVDYNKLLKSLERAYRIAVKEFDELLLEDTPSKEKRFTITAQRNLTLAYSVDPFLKFLQMSQDKELKLTTIEVLGWYRYSIHRDKIISTLQELVKVELDDDIKNNMNKTIARLK